MMESKGSLSVRVGIFIIVGILLLLGLSLQVDRNLFKKPEGMELFTHFSDIKGLEEGAPVMLAGLEVGAVTSMQFEPEKAKVKVRMFIRSPYHLKKDSVASIRLQSLLGQNYISVDYGDPNSPDLAYGNVVKSMETVDVDEALQIVGNLGEELKSLVKDFNENQSHLTNQISSLIDENRDNIKKTTESFASMGPKLDTALDSVNELIGEANQGKGTIGKLFKDETLYTRMTQMSDSFTSLTGDIRSGQGTLSQLIYSDDLLESSKQAIKEVRAAARNMNSLISDNRQPLDDFAGALEKISPKLEGMVDNLIDVSEKINKGEGTLGKMVNDPSLYDDTKNAVNQIKTTFEGAEEQSVISTVLGVLIGAVM